MREYTKAGSKAFNKEVDGILMKLGKDVAKAVGEPFIALILGGGYGRAEGACVIRDGKESLYNDLDLFLITRTAYVISDKVKDVQRTYEHLLHIDVDIGAPLTVEQLQSLPNQLMWHDLLNGHLVLNGPQDIISANMPGYMSDPVPQVETIRLALNRGSGLLQAIIADHTKQLSDPDFIRRNYYKAALAFGDGLTITHGVYTVFLPDRLERLKSIADKLPKDLGDTVIRLYSDAIDFKQRPDTFDAGQTGTETLLQAAGIWCTLFLSCEEIRTGRTFPDTASYVEASFIREPDQHRGKNLLRNVVKNLRMSKVSLKYPREQLYRELVSLMGSPEPGSVTWNQRSEAFLRLWNQFN